MDSAAERRDEVSRAQRGRAVDPRVFDDGAQAAYEAALLRKATNFGPRRADLSARVSGWDGTGRCYAPLMA